MSDETGEERKEAGAGLMQYSPEGMMPFGPVHPSLKEPEYFKLILEGEKIVQVIPRIGYVHRGIERAAQERTWVKNIYLFERICGICSFAHSISYTQAVEAISPFEVPDRARYIRLVVAELERIHSHLLWLGLVGHWAGFDTLFMWVWKDREHVLDLEEEITGNRVHKSYSTFGGVRKDLPDNIGEKAKAELGYIEKRATYYKDLVQSEETLAVRTRGVGRITQETARKLSPVGPLLRCTGIGRDVRVEDPYAAYDEVRPEVQTSKDGDIASLLVLRLDEVLDSCRMVKEALEKIPAGPVKAAFPRTVHEGESSFHVEAPRGELFYFVKSAGGSVPERVKIRTPTMANLLTATEMLKGQTLADVPVVLTGMDPCFGCMDRVSVFDVAKSKGWSVSGEELREYGIEYYRRKRG
ncbi:MAG: nickel-dependent hydrogenase large subunit [Nitrososphaerota archaeon]|nr:nickel-dependent hydrogenase large subunit [Nitrososphaerota archaeon]